MVSYVVTGASRGIGLALVQALRARRALRPSNTLQDRSPEPLTFAIVQDQNSCDELQQLAGPNCHVILGDLDKPETLHSAAAEVAKITGGSLDILINNAALTPSTERRGHTLASYIGKDNLLINDLNDFYKTNVVGTVAVTNAFLPLVGKGTQKKIINISSAAGDPEFVEKTGYASAAYGISKAALNYVNKKYAVEFREKGYTFLAISPGLVETRPNHLANKATWDALINTFKAGYPDWNGVPLLPSQSAELLLDVIDRATTKDSGGFVSQYGNKRWL